MDYIRYKTLKKISLRQNIGTYNWQSKIIINLKKCHKTMNNQNQLI